MSTKRKTNVIIDLIEDTVVASRILENIEKVMDSSGLVINSWYPITYLMGIDFDKTTKQNEHLTDEFMATFDKYVNKENTNRDTAVLIYNKFDDQIRENLKQFPQLKAS